MGTWWCQEGVGRPNSSRKRSHTSLIVGYDGTACHRRSTGTSPTIAIVAACSSSATSGPTNVAPTSTPRSVSITARAAPW